MHSNASLGTNSACPSHTRPRHDAQAPHGSFTNRRGRLGRTRRTFCGRTRSGRPGTPYHRMPRPASDLDRASKMSTEGMSIAGIARVLGVHPTTVRRWLERAGAHAKRFSEERRRTPARARKPLFVECVLELLRGHDHFIKPHLSLSIGREHHTPALVAGGEQRRLILGDSLSWVPPIARGLERVVLDHTQRRHGSPGARS